MRLIVGLGNPGKPYISTRHNVGYEVLDRLAARLGWATPGEFNRLARSNFDALAIDGTMSIHSGGTEKLLLLKPTTYMNLSGRSVQSAMSFYQLSPQELLVVLDDLALPVGKIRLRSGGSSGGHNGLRDIEQAIGTEQYPRLRVGIDPPPPNVPGRDYVLGRFSDEQRTRLEPALDRAADATLMWIEQGINAAMNRFNADEPTTS